MKILSIIIAIVCFCAGCNTQDTNPNPLASDTDPVEVSDLTDTETTEIEAPIPVTFNEILNNPYAFESKQEEQYSFRLTSKHELRFTVTRKPQLGSVPVLAIHGESPDFGHIVLRIVSNDDICPDSIRENINSDSYEYIFTIKIYRVEKIKTDYINVWADLRSLPEKVKL